MPKPLKYISTKKLIEFRDSEEFKSSGYQTDIQRFVQDEIFYRAYMGIHGKKTALKEYSRQSKLRRMIWLWL